MRIHLIIKVMMINFNFHNHNKVKKIKKFLIKKILRKNQIKMKFKKNKKVFINWNKINLLKIKMF